MISTPGGRPSSKSLNQSFSCTNPTSTTYRGGGGGGAAGSSVHSTCAPLPADPGVLGVPGADLLGLPVGVFATACTHAVTTRTHRCEHVSKGRDGVSAGTRTTRRTTRTLIANGSLASFFTSTGYLYTSAMAFVYTSLRSSYGMLSKRSTNVTISNCACSNAMPSAQFTTKYAQEPYNSSCIGKARAAKVEDNACSREGPRTEGGGEHGRTGRGPHLDHVAQVGYIFLPQRLEMEFLKVRQDVDGPHRRHAVEDAVVVVDAELVVAEEVVGGGSRGVGVGRAGRGRGGGAGTRGPGVLTGRHRRQRQETKGSMVRAWEGEMDRDVDPPSTGTYIRLDGRFEGLRRGLRHGRAAEDPRLGPVRREVGHAVVFAVPHHQLLQSQPHGARAGWATVGGGW